jgi:ribonuclease G
MRKKILISKEPWETRAAITRDSNLQNVYFAPNASQGLERCYFKGKVTKVLPGIQTAFVDIGQEKSGFLHISEIDRDLAVSSFQDVQVDDESAAKPKRTVDTNIGTIFKENDEILVQVSKEPIYEKGAKLTTCFTLPGRFIVLMPNIPKFGISKKIESREERARLKEIVSGAVPEGMGAVIRTSAEDATAKEITKDIAYLVKTWNSILSNFEKASEKEKIYEDLPLELQVIRDNLDSDVESVIIDDKPTHELVYKFVKGIAPEHSQKVKYWRVKSNLFEYHEVDKQLEKALNKKVELKSGGSLIIESTEAMTVIDVNTGKFTGKKNMEETILKNNLEAAEEVVRQLRLRNIGGLIVIDFVDMSTSTNQRKLISFFEQKLKELDKFQSVVLGVSEFGLVQMTRKRSGKTLIQQLMETCRPCRGLGVVKSVNTQCSELLRKVTHDLKSRYKGEKALTLVLNPTVFEIITTVEFNTILQLEKEFDCNITLVSKREIAVDSYKIEK